MVVRLRIKIKCKLGIVLGIRFGLVVFDLTMTTVALIATL